MKHLAVLLFTLFAFTSCETARGFYDNHPGGSYSYRTPDGRLVTVTIGPKPAVSVFAK